MFSAVNMTAIQRAHSICDGSAFLVLCLALVYTLKMFKSVLKREGEESAIY